MSKKNLILGGILVALIFIVYLYQGPWKNDLGPNFLSQLEAEQIDKIEIIRDNATSTLIKEGEAKWQVDGSGDFYVDPEVAQELEEKLAQLITARFEVVSSDEDRKPELNTDLESGTQVKLYQDDQELAHFIIGFLDSSGLASSYVARPDYPETYVASNVDLSRIRFNDDWRSRVIFDSAKEDITKLRFQYPDREFSLEKQITTEENEEGEEVEVITWQGVSPREFAVDSEKIDSILEVMTNLEASIIPEQNFEGTRLTDHLIIVEASGDELSNTIMVGGEADLGDEVPEEMSFYYAKEAVSDSIYLITEEQRDLLDQTISSLN